MNWLFDEQGQVGFDPPGNTRAVNRQVAGRIVMMPHWDLEGLGGWAPRGDIGITAGGDGRLEWYRENFRGEDRPVVELTAAGREVMTGQRPPRVLLPREVRRGPAGANRASRIARAPEPDGPWGEAEEALFQALRARRHELASAARVPAYVIAHDRTLRDLARLRPRTADALGDVYGLGAAKIARSGEAFLEVIARFT